MQNRYAGDIGDYVKLAVLRSFTEGLPPRRLAVVWWLFPDERHNADGGHREYLARPDEWKQFDPSLFKALAEIHHSLISENRSPEVRLLEEAALLPMSVFVRDGVPCDYRPFIHRPAERKRWLSRIQVQIEGCDLVFLDPDNGIAPEGLRLTRRRAGKSVTVDEIKSFERQGRAIIVYHHQTRRRDGHRLELQDLAMRLDRSGLSVSGVLRAKPWSPRAFFVLNGDPELQRRAEAIERKWCGWISWKALH